MRGHTISFKLGARILQYEGGTKLSEFRGTHPLMSPLMAIGYRGWDRKHPEFRDTCAAMSPSIVVGGHNLLECWDTSYLISHSMGLGRRGSPNFQE